MTAEPGGISRSDIDKIARLARISLDDNGVDTSAADELRARLGNILALVDQLKSVDTHGVMPMANPHDATQRLRADSVTEADMRGAFQAIAPQTEAGLYLVPKVIE